MKRSSRQDGAFAVDEVFVGLGRNLGQRDVAVVEDGVGLAFLGEAHLFDGVEAAFGAAHYYLRVGRHALVVQVEFGQGPASRLSCGSFSIELLATTKLGYKKNWL